MGRGIRANDQRCLLDCTDREERNQIAFEESIIAKSIEFEDAYPKCRYQVHYKYSRGQNNQIL